MYIMMWYTSHIPMRVVYQMYHTLYFSISKCEHDEIHYFIALLCYHMYTTVDEVLTKARHDETHCLVSLLPRLRVVIFVSLCCSLVVYIVPQNSCRPWEDPYSSLDIIHASTSCQTPTHFKLFISICPITKSVDNPVQFISLLRKTWYPFVK